MLDPFSNQIQLDMREGVGRRSGHDAAPPSAGTPVEQCAEHVGYGETAAETRDLDPAAQRRTSHRSSAAR